MNFQQMKPGTSVIPYFKLILTEQSISEIILLILGHVHCQGYILTNLINMSVKLFSTVSIVFFPVDFKSARYHPRFCIFN